MNNFLLTNKNLPICTTQECYDAAKEYELSLNLSSDPCDDFYSFSCGGWLERNPVDSTSISHSQLDEVSAKIGAELREILEDDIEPNEPHAFHQVRYAYKTCMNTDQIESEQLAPIIELLKELPSGWPMIGFDPKQKSSSQWAQTISFLIRRLGIFPLITITIRDDQLNATQRLISLDQASLVAPRELLLSNGILKSSLETTYVRWILATATEIALQAGMNRPKIKDAKEVMEFEHALAKISSSSEKRRNPWNFKRFKLKNINFPQFNMILSDLLCNSLDPDTFIQVFELDYLDKLQSLLEETDTRIVSNYLGWRTVKALAGDANFALRDAWFEFEKNIFGLHEKMPRWKFCLYFIQNSNLDHALAAAWIQKRYKLQDLESRHQSAADLIKAVQFASMKRLSTWMDQDTLYLAQEKAIAMKTFLGYPSWYDNKTELDRAFEEFTIGPSHTRNVMMLLETAVKIKWKTLNVVRSRDERTIPAYQVNAFYNPMANMMMIPSAMLDPPFFWLHGPKALQFGGLGVIIGHEWTHGFDDAGRHYDFHGQLNSWWLPQTENEFETRAECFREQYNNFHIRHLEKFNLTQLYVNGENTLGENIADSAGVRQAFLAYRRTWADQDVLLPGPIMDRFTPEQLFFIAYAHVFCESTTDASLINEVMSDNHSPSHLRVFGSLRNSPEFSEVWNCSPESAMNAGKDRCELW